MKEIMKIGRLDEEVMYWFEPALAAPYMLVYRNEMRDEVEITPEFGGIMWG